MQARDPHVMGTDDIGALLWRFSLPATLAMGVLASYNIVDTIFIGRLGSEALAALSVAFPVQMMLSAIGIGTGVGAASLISRSLGAGEPEQALRTLGQVLFLALFFGVIATVIGQLFLEPLLLLFGATPDILPLTVEYMSVITLGAVFLFSISMLNNVVRSEGNPIYSMQIMVISSVVNIILDPIFIFALGLGIRGAAIATVLAKALGTAMALHYFLTGKSILRVRLAFLRPHPPTLLEIYRVGLPSMLMQLATNTSIIFVNNVLGAFGHIPIAVMGLVMRLQMFAFMPVIGISQGMLPIIGYNFGAGKYLRIREAMLKALLAGTAFMLVLGVLFFSFPSVFLGVFSDDPDILATGVPAVRIMVLMYPLISTQMVSVAFFQGIGRGLPSLVLSLSREFLVYLPLVFGLSGALGVTGVWMARPVADFTAFLIALGMVLLEFRRRRIPLRPRPRRRAS